MKYCPQINLRTQVDHGATFSSLDLVKDLYCNNLSLMDLIKKKDDRNELYDG